MHTGHTYRMARLTETVMCSSSLVDRNVHVGESCRSKGKSDRRQETKHRRFVVGAHGSRRVLGRRDRQRSP